MAVMKIYGLKEYQSAIEKLYRNAEGCIKKAVFEGAGVIYEECKQAIDTLPVLPLEKSFGTPEKKIDGVTIIQKRGLQESFGISKMLNDSGFINVKVGFDGYNEVETMKYPDGQPNVMIARAVESGTSFREKHPFMRPAVNRAKPRAVKAMGAQIETDMKLYGF